MKNWLIIVILFLAFNMKADLFKQKRYFSPSPKWCYEKSSCFTRFPAYFGYYIMQGSGYLFNFPLLLSISKFKLKDTILYCEVATQPTFGNTGYLVTGAPFDILEKTFWDFPCYIYGAVFNGNESGNESSKPLDTSNQRKKQ